MTALLIFKDKSMTKRLGLHIATIILAGMVVTAQAGTALAPLPANQVRHGFAVAQACEAEIDDDLTAYGECIGHAIDRVPGQRLALLGIHFQAWLIADLAARQGGVRAVQLRQRYQHLLQRSQRTTGWSIQKLCEVKRLVCEPVKVRLQQKI